MNQFKIFIYLTRLNKPIGYMLLFWPCAFGLMYAFKKQTFFDQIFLYMILFFLGSILMRSAGCIINDVVDRNIDKKVMRTKNRPIPSGLITVKRSLVYACILCLFAFFILIQFNFLTIALGFASMFLAFSYPFMKRITYWPQLFLGLTFNWGIIMGWTSVNPEITIEIVLLYLSAIFWTLGYDTIYGLQDVIDDEIIGMKSTSIKFKNYSKQFVSMCYAINIFILIFLFKDLIGINLFSVFFLIFSLSLIIQLFYFDKKKPEKCLKAFKFNNISGLFLFLSIFNL